MSSDIQFGDLEQSEPQRATRPDQDAHFATAVVGQQLDDELLIFVDLDVMRDMEAHALSNTRVELGGVMLGRQQIDDQGRPFVVISECLRAEHYEATSVNFKFTHETWSQISRQRSEFLPDLEMVGWYHTHPGLSVFLSGMDLFICNHFFDRPLDVALVIDPVGQDRGWFQWTEGDRPVTHRTRGFILTTGRLRQIELDQFARLYNKEPEVNLDPRYSGSELTGRSQPTVHLMDNRKPIYELAVIGMLLMQFLLVGVLAWRFLDSQDVQSAATDAAPIAEMENQLEQMLTEQGRTARENAYREVLQTLAAGQTGDASLVDKFAELRSEQVVLGANLEGQMALVSQLRSERDEVMNRLNDQSTDNEKLEIQLVTTRKKLGDSQDRVDRLTRQLDGGESAAVGSTWMVTLAWWWLLIAALLVGGVGTGLGVAVGRRDGNASDSGERPGGKRNRADEVGDATLEFPSEALSDTEDDSGTAASDSLTMDGNEPVRESGDTQRGS